MKKSLTILFLLFYSIGLFGQIIEAETKFQLTNPNDSLRKVKDVAIPTIETNAVRGGFFISGMAQFAASSATGDSISLTIYPQISTLEAGVTLNFISPLTNDDAVRIVINGISGTYNLYKKATHELDTADLRGGQMVSIVYDGTNFQVISQLNKSCPNGFVEVTREYCIQQNENAPVYFWEAINNCGKQNARVCNWGEWYYACYLSAQLGINGMLGNWEWADGGGNSLGFTTPPTGDTGLEVGQTLCTDAGSSIVDTTHTNVRAQPKTYHCCYSLR